jgi:4-hydroxybenzoyl-CoA reductase subunit alpha
VPYGVLPIAENEYPLAREKVRYRGDPVAAVAAIDEATAESARWPDPGRVRTAARLLHPQGGAMKAGAVAIHDDKPDNVLREVHAEFGDVAAGFAEADLVREKTYTFAEVNHATWSSTPRWPSTTRRATADAAHHHPGAVLRAPEGGAPACRWTRPTSA